MRFIFTGGSAKKPKCFATIPRSRDESNFQEAIENTPPPTGLRASSSAGRSGAASLKTERQPSSRNLERPPIYFGMVEAIRRQSPPHTGIPCKKDRMLHELVVKRWFIPLFVRWFLSIQSMLALKPAIQLGFRVLVPSCPVP